MSEFSLTLPELTTVVQEPHFQTRIALLGAHAADFKHEGGFAVKKWQPDRWTYSTTLLPESPEQNEGLDPTNELVVERVTNFGQQIDPHLALLVHSHADTMHDSGAVRTPSDHDLVNLLGKHCYPANPGHIGGVALWWGWLPSTHLLLYRPDPNRFDVEQLKANLQAAPFTTRNRLEAMTNAGLRIAHLAFVNDRIAGLDRLSLLFGDE